MTTLTLKSQPAAPLEAEAITPDRFIGKTSVEIAALPVTCGNQPAALGDWFIIDGDGTSDIVIEGDLARLKQIGTGMTQGKITIHGDVGMHLGATMRGGEIAVHGSAGDWAGAEMSGGVIRIMGNAGHGLGGAYRGSRRGMKKGTIIVTGNAGNELGATMRRGLIAVLGNVGDFCGAFMIAGSIIVFGQLGARAGAGMKRGTIVSFQAPELLPTFRSACSYRPTFLRMLLEQLRGLDVAVAPNQLDGCFHRYVGDMNALGKGEILVWEGQ
ncbi:MAG TPA: formylmethanofuran dehydrogenase subunit C [Anaerolineae bacterium]|nr:formylmethanofuran dehydrogenase subunit C [Anaerolineae bacterium]